MRGLKKSLKFTGRVLLGSVLFFLVYGLAAYVCSRITIEQEEGKNKEVAIYISTNGVHTDIIVPIRNDQMDWSKLVKFGYTSVSDTNYQYLSLGWGEIGRAHV